jgi:hypothetical protein
MSIISDSPVDLYIGQEFHVITENFGIWTYEYDGREECQRIIGSTPAFLTMTEAKIYYDKYIENKYSNKQEAWDK